MSAESKYTNRIAKGSAIIFIAAFAATVLGYVLRLFFSRTLSVEDFGLLYAGIVFIGFFGLFRDFGLGQALVKFIPEFSVKKQGDKIKSLIVFALIFEFVIAVCIILPIVFFSDNIATGYFHNPKAVYVIYAMAFMFLFNVFVSIFQSIFQGTQKIYEYSLVQPINTILTLVISYLLLVFYSGLDASLASVAYAIAVAATAIVLVFMFAFRRTVSNFRSLKTRISSSMVKETFSFSLPVFIGFIGGFILGYTDTMVITYFKSLQDVAVYQVALPTSQILWMFSSALVVVLFPLISEMWARKETVILSDGISMLIKLSFVIILPFALMMLSFPDFIISFLFGQQYVQGAFVLQILAIAAIFSSLWSILSAVFAGIGKPMIGTKIVLLAAAINLVLNVVLVQYYSIAGVAFATLLSFAVAFVVGSYYLRKHLNVRVSFGSLTKAVVGGLLMLALIFGIKTMLVLNPWIEIWICVISGLLFYTVYIFITKTVTRKELLILTRVNLPIPKIIIKIAHRLARD